MRWFISDLHLDHEKVLIGIRKEHFPTLLEWSQGILEAINSSVQSGDSLYLLGDIAFHDIQKWRQKIRAGDLWLIRGNHDPSWSQCHNAFGRTRVRDVYQAKLCNEPCWLSHYPHAFWPKSHYGAYHLYGHMHGQREETLDEWMPQRRSVDVCPETIYELLGRWGPINEEELLDHFKQRSGHDPVDYYRKRRGDYQRGSS